MEKEASTHQSESAVTAGCDAYADSKLNLETTSQFTPSGNNMNEGWRTMEKEASAHQSESAVTADTSADADSKLNLKREREDDGHSSSAEMDFLCSLGDLYSSNDGVGPSQSDIDPPSGPPVSLPQQSGNNMNEGWRTMEKEASTHQSESAVTADTSADADSKLNLKREREDDGHSSSAEMDFLCSLGDLYSSNDGVGPSQSDIDPPSGPPVSLPQQSGNNMNEGWRTMEKEASTHQSESAVTADTSADADSKLNLKREREDDGHSSSAEMDFLCSLGDLYSSNDGVGPSQSDIDPPSGPPVSLPQQSGNNMNEGWRTMEKEASTHQSESAVTADTSADADSKLNLETTSQFTPSGNNMNEGFHSQPTVSTAPNQPGQTPFRQAVQPYNMVPHSQNMTGAMPFNSGGFMHQPGSQDSFTATSSSSRIPYSTPSGSAGQFMAHQGHAMPPSHGPQRTQSGPVTLQRNNNVMGNMFSQAGPNSLTSSSSHPPLTGAIEIVPPPQKKFEPKSSVWADILSRGLVNFNISGPKTNPLADIGVNFEAINRRDKRLEKPTNTPATSTINMGKAKGSGTGLGRSGATAMRPPPYPMTGSGMPMGGGMGVGSYKGMNQNQPMGMGMGMGVGMNQNQPMGMGMGPGMNMNMGGYCQGYSMQQQNPGMVRGPNVPGNNYNPMMGQGGYNPQQSYGPPHRIRDGGETPQVTAPRAASPPPPQVSAPRASSPPTGPSTDYKTVTFVNESPSQKVETFDEFDPRGAFSGAGELKVNTLVRLTAAALLKPRVYLGVDFSRDCGIEPGNITLLANGERYIVNLVVDKSRGRLYLGGGFKKVVHALRLRDGDDMTFGVEGGYLRVVSVNHHQSADSENCTTKGKRRLMRDKAHDKYEKKMTELSERDEHKTNECHEIWMPPTSANEQPENLSMEPDEARSLVSLCEKLKQQLMEEQKMRKELYNYVQETKGNIRVFCRCRPLSKEETSILDFDGAEEGELGVITGKSSKKFKFDRVYTLRDSQAVVFADASTMIISVLDGYNVCIFAYGQTGTGKTFTMEGTPQNRGVNYRTVQQLFEVARERKDTFSYNISVSLLEVYNGLIRDLLATSPTSKNLEIKHSEGSHHVPGLVEENVENVSQVWNVLEAGSNARAVGSNNVNEHSSRSHCMLFIRVKGKNLMNGDCTESKLWLVDLAGSERLGKIDVQGERLKESQNINKSLSALGDVIYALATKSSHIPYRNSKLTHLLQDSLGGNSKALMYLQISPSEHDLTETISSLNFASRVRGVELGPARKQSKRLQSKR